MNFRIMSDREIMLVIGSGLLVATLVIAVAIIGYWTYTVFM